MSSPVAYGDGPASCVRYWERLQPKIEEMMRVGDIDDDIAEMTPPSKSGGTVGRKWKSVQESNLKIVALLREGKTQKEIASILGMSKTTLNSRIKRCKLKEEL